MRRVEAGPAVARMLLGVRRWIRTAVSLRAQGEVVFVFTGEKMLEERWQCAGSDSRIGQERRASALNSESASQDSARL